MIFVIFTFFCSFKSRLYFKRPLTTYVILKTPSVGSQRRMNSSRRLWLMVSAALCRCAVCEYVCSDNNYAWCVYLYCSYVTIIVVHICPQVNLECQATAVHRPPLTPAPSPHKAAMTRRETRDILHHPGLSYHYWQLYLYGHGYLFRLLGFEDSHCCHMLWLDDSQVRA